MNTKELLLHHTRLAFDGDDEMSLKAALWKLPPELATRPLLPGVREAPTIEQIVYHLAYWKIEYCRQGFGRWTREIPKSTGNIADTVALLDSAQAHLVKCLESCTEDALAKPIPTRCHGQSAAHFFTIMAIHDVSHAAQIRTRRRLAANASP